MFSLPVSVSEGGKLSERLRVAALCRHTSQHSCGTLHVGMALLTALLTVV